MDKYVVSKDWVTAAGFRAVVIMATTGHHCGYVAVPKEHPLFGKDYGDACDCLTFPSEEGMGKRGVIPMFCSNGESRPDVVFDVHGSLTYSGGNGEYPVKAPDVWWFGYDCGHAGDAKSEEYIAEMQTKYPDHAFLYHNYAGGVFRDLEYNIAECESLAQQLIDRVNFAK